MAQKVYHITEFANKASISVRTLRYYDKCGLLVPSLYDESGYKLYTDGDFIHLQSILSFKFLGFSLKEINKILSEDPEGLQKRLVQQKEMLREKQAQIGQIIEAINKVEESLNSDEFNYDLMTKLIQVTQMDLKPEWVNHYLTKDERVIMREIALKSYSKEALKKMAVRGWSQEDHQQHLNNYHYFRSSLTRLVKESYSPDSPEAQELARFLHEMNKRFSEDDPQIREGMKKSWEQFNALPDNKKPKTYAIPDLERKFIKEACLIFYKS